MLLLLRAFICIKRLFHIFAHRNTYNDNWNEVFLIEKSIILILVRGRLYVEKYETMKAIEPFWHAIERTSHTRNRVYLYAHVVNFIAIPTTRSLDIFSSLQLNMSTMPYSTAMTLSNQSPKLIFDIWANISWTVIVQWKAELTVRRM